MATPLAAAEISNLGAEIAGLDVTIVQAQVLAAAEEQMVAQRLVSNFQFAGVGRIANLPYTTGVDFGAAVAEGIEVQHEIHDIQADAATMLKYTLDLPVSYEGENWGAGSALGAIKEDVGRAYANKVDGLIHAAINAATGNDIDIGATFALSHIATAYQTLASLKAPGPYILLLHPDHWNDLYGTITLTAPAPNSQLMAGPGGGMYVGNISGFEVFVDPNCTGSNQATYKSVAFSQRGVWWAWKPTAIPTAGQVGGVANGALGLEVGWRYDFRSYVISATMIGAAVVRRLGGSDTPWVVNMANPA